MYGRGDEEEVEEEREMKGNRLLQREIKRTYTKNKKYKKNKKNKK